MPFDWRWAALAGPYEVLFAAIVVLGGLRIAGVVYLEWCWRVLALISSVVTFIGPLAHAW